MNCRPWGSHYWNDSLDETGSEKPRICESTRRILAAVSGGPTFAGETRRVLSVEDCRFLDVFRAVEIMAGTKIGGFWFLGCDWSRGSSTMAACCGGAPPGTKFGGGNWLYIEGRNWCGVRNGGVCEDRMIVAWLECDYSPSHRVQCGVWDSQPPLGPSNIEPGGAVLHHRSIDDVLLPGAIHTRCHIGMEFSQPHRLKVGYVGVLCGFRVFAVGIQ